MKPYGREKKIKGGKKWKEGSTWWQSEFSTIVSRRKIMEFAARQQDIPPDIQKIINKHFWDLI